MLHHTVYILCLTILFSSHAQSNRRNPLSSFLDSMAHTLDELDAVLSNDDAVGDADGLQELFRGIFDSKYGPTIEVDGLFDAFRGVSVVPVPGPHCGPANHAVKWVIPDHVLLNGALVSLDTACMEHDTCYDRCGGQSQCDATFLRRLKQQCDHALHPHTQAKELRACKKGVAAWYYLAVSLMAKSFHAYPERCPQ